MIFPEAWLDARSTTDTEQGQSIRDTLRPALHPLQDTPQPGPLAKTLLALGVLGALALSFQATAPLNHEPTAPPWVNWLFLTMMPIGLGTWLKAAATSERIAGVLCLFAVLYVLVLGKFHDSQSVEYIASRLASGLSSRWHSLPLVGLVCGWLAIALGWICAGATREAIGSQNRAALVIASSMGLAIGVFGVQAVIGYATGQTSLLPG